MDELAGFEGTHGEDAKICLFGSGWCSADASGGTIERRPGFCASLASVFEGVLSGRRGRVFKLDCGSGSLCVCARRCAGLFHHDTFIACGESEFDATLWEVAFKITSCVSVEAGDLTLGFITEIFVDDAEFGEILDGGCDVALDNDTLPDDETDGIAIEAMTSVVWIHLVCGDGRLEFEVVEQDIGEDIIVCGEVLHDCERSGSHTAPGCHTCSTSVGGVASAEAA